MDGNQKGKCCVTKHENGIGDDENLTRAWHPSAIVPSQLGSLPNSFSIQPFQLINQLLCCCSCSVHGMQAFVSTSGTWTRTGYSITVIHTSTLYHNLYFSRSYLFSQFSLSLSKSFITQNPLERQTRFTIIVFVVRICFIWRGKTF